MNIPQYVKDVLKCLNNCGYEAYMVGGCVRDCLMGNEPNDYDVTTNATPEQMLEIFKSFKVIPTGLKHGTVTVVLQGQQVEVTTYRIDGEYLDNRHPQKVTFTNNLQEDLSRRDFTINAMAMDVDGNIADFYGGREDLKNGIIKCVGSAETRFEEDALRILRAIRFASVLGFEVEGETAAAVHSKVHLLGNISKERILSELSKLLCGKNAYGTLTAYCDVIRCVIPNMVCTNFDAIQKSVPDLYVRLALLFDNAQAAQNALATLKGDNYTKAAVKALVEAKLNPYMSKKDIKRHLFKYGEESFKRHIAYTEAKYNVNCTKLEQQFRDIILAGECYKVSMLSINGSDVMELGASGRQTGDVLKMLLDQVIDENLPNQKHQLVEEAAKIIKIM